MSLDLIFSGLNFGVCVSALAAAVLADLLEYGSLRTRAAADAAFALVVSFPRLCDQTEAAAVFASFEERGSFRTFTAAALAVDRTRAPDTLVAIGISLKATRTYTHNSVAFLGADSSSHTTLEHRLRCDPSLSGVDLLGR